MCYFKMPGLYMPFVLHASEVAYIRRMREVPRTNISSNMEIINLSRCGLLVRLGKFT